MSPPAGQVDEPSRFLADARVAIPLMGTSSRPWLGNAWAPSAIPTRWTSTPVAGSWSPSPPRGVHRQRHDSGAQVHPDARLHPRRTRRPPLAGDVRPEAWRARPVGPERWPRAAGLEHRDAHRPAGPVGERGLARGQRRPSPGFGWLERKAHAASTAQAMWRWEPHSLRGGDNNAHDDVVREEADPRARRARANIRNSRLPGPTVVFQLSLILTLTFKSTLCANWTSSGMSG